METDTRGKRDGEGYVVQEINLSSCQASWIINHTNDNGDTQCVHNRAHTQTLECCVRFGARESTLYVHLNRFKFCSAVRFHCPFLNQGKDTSKRIFS